MRCNNRFTLSLVLVLTNLLFSCGSYADPPNRVARLSYTKGDVSFSPAAAKQTVWVVGRINRPLVSGDRIWADTHARAELQLGSAAVRIEDETSLRVINLNNQIAQ